MVFHSNTNFTLILGHLLNKHVLLVVNRFKYFHNQISTKGTGQQKTKFLLICIRTHQNSLKTIKQLKSTTVATWTNTTTKYLDKFEIYRWDIIVDCVRLHFIITIIDHYILLHCDFDSHLELKNFMDCYSNFVAHLLCLIIWNSYPILEKIQDSFNNKHERMLFHISTKNKVNLRGHCTAHQLAKNRFNLQANNPRTWETCIFDM